MFAKARPEECDYEDVRRFLHHAIKRVLAAARNHKQRARLSACYSSGLRVNELVHLKAKDIESENMCLCVQCVKGGKNRNTILSKENLLRPRLHYRQYRPQDGLFPGAFTCEHLFEEIGITAVWHTWGQTLAYPPHIHCFVPGGGLYETGISFMKSRDKFFLPVMALSNLFGGGAAGVRKE